MENLGTRFAGPCSREGLRRKRPPPFKFEKKYSRRQHSMTHSRVNLKALLLVGVVLVSGLLVSPAEAADEGAEAGPKNTLHIKFVRVAPGKFQMGSDLPTDAKALGQSPLFPNGDEDERP